MKKLLSLLTITTMTAIVPAPLLANTAQIRVKRDTESSEKDVTTGFDIKISEKYNKDSMLKIDNKDKDSKSIDNKYYIVIWRNKKDVDWKINKFKNDRELVPIEILPTENQVLRKWKLGLQITFVGRDSYTWDGLEYLIKSFYRWDGIGEPNLPEINSSTGEITDWKQPTKNDFQQGISFSLVDGSKTATWSNAGMRLTVNGKTNINIDNSNVAEVYWDGAKQNMLEHKVNINVKPETSEKTHKLVIKYDINGTKYTSEDIDVVMATKIDPPKPIVKENLSDVIKFDNNNDLGNIIDNNDDTIKAAIINKNSRNVDFFQIKITAKTDTKATLTVKSDSKSYVGSVYVKYNVVPATTVDLKIDVTSSASRIKIDKDYLSQIDKSKMTNKVDTFYYANRKSKIKIKQPSTGNVITGIVYGCDEQWNKTSQSNTIDPVSGLEIDKGQYGSIDGRYLIELKHKYLSTHTKIIYLQISEKQKLEHYLDTPNGKQFEQWAEDNGEKNIRGSNASQLNNLFEVSKTWKKSLAHLDLKLDKFIVDNIKNVTQDEIDNYKTKLLASVKSQVEKYAPNVVENTDYVINFDNLVAGDWTASKDVKFQSVDGSTKLLSFTVKTIQVQQKVQQIPPTPDNNKKSGLSGLTIVGIVIGSLTGLTILGWLFKRFVINPFILGSIREKKQKARIIREDKALAETQAEEEDEKEKKGK